MNRLGFFAAGGGALAPMVVQEIAYFETSGGPAGDVRAPVSGSYSLAAVPHVPGLDRWIVVTYASVRGDSNSSIVVPANCNVNGAAFDLLVCQATNNSNGAHSAVGYKALGSGDTTVYVYIDNLNNVNPKALTIYCVQGKTLTVDDSDQQSSTVASVTMTIPLTCVNDGAAAFIAGSFRGSGTLSSPVNFAYDNFFDLSTVGLAS